MFVAELFEAKAKKTVVIISGGFHPFHPGHLSMYTGAVKAFPGADVYVVATDDQSERPFPFSIKKQLATIAGVPADSFVQVKSPFAPREVTGRYDPESTTLIFVRSEKDRNESPRPGGVKKNGDPAYLQPLTKNPAPMSQHGYMAYLPTIEFAAGPAGMTSATQIRTAWPQSDAQTKQAIVADLYPRIAKNAKLMGQVTSILDQVLVGELAEGWKSKLAGAALAGAAAFGGGAQAQTAPVDTTNASVVQSLVNPVAQQRFAKMHADTTAKLTDPRYTHNPNALAQHQAAPQQQHAEMLQNIKNIEQWDNPYRIIQMAMNMAGVTPQEVLQNLPKGYKLPTTEPKGTFVPKDLSKLNVKEEASGVIATRAQAKDPRYSMSLTKDVRPGAVEKNLRAFNLIAPKKK